MLSEEPSCPFSGSASSQECLSGTSAPWFNCWPNLSEEYKNFLTLLSSTSLLDNTFYIYLNGMNCFNHHGEGLSYRAYSYRTYHIFPDRLCAYSNYCIQLQKYWIKLFYNIEWNYTIWFLNQNKYEILRGKKRNNIELITKSITLAILHQHWGNKE